jgi:hypothetical protein
LKIETIEKNNYSLLVRDLTLLGYFSSELVVLKRGILQRYDGNAEYKPGQKLGPHNYYFDK